jgi:hypothetical protein
MIGDSIKVGCKCDRQKIYATFFGRRKEFAASQKFVGRVLPVDIKHAEGERGVNF